MKRDRSLRPTARHARREPVRAAESEDSRTVDSRTLDAVIQAVRHVHGDSAIGRLSEQYEDTIGTFPTGVPSLDAAIGIGGFPLAKLVQISGAESVGKSTLCKKLIAQALDHGVIPYFIDGEMSADTPERYAALGISRENVLWTDVMWIEDAFTVAATAIRALRQRDASAIIFLDSLAAFRIGKPRKNSTRQAVRPSDTPDFYDAGGRPEKALFLAQHLGDLVSLVKHTQIGIVFVNQMRMKARAMPFEDPTYEPGGYALRHWCHLILRIKRIGQIKDGTRTVGIKSKIVIRKSKLAPPYRSAVLNLFFDGRVEEGVDDRDED